VTEPGFYPDVPEADYHADRGSLSVGGAKLLLQAPALYRWRIDHPEVKDYFDLGSAAHLLVLGVGPKVRVIYADSWVTKAAREERDAAREAGEVPLLEADWVRVNDMADALTHHPFAAGLLEHGQPEVSAYAVDPATGILLRGRFDWLGEWIISDYKTAKDASPEGFARSVANYGYHMQAAWYLDLCELNGEPREAFAFVVQEKAEPYMVAVYDLDDTALEIGARRNRRALDLYRQCLDEDRWPGYADGADFTTLALPRWALYQEGVR
jgi:hypothetical protein